LKQGLFDKALAVAALSQVYSLPALYANAARDAILKPTEFSGILENIKRLYPPGNFFDPQ
jgi:hypothetical protein